MRGWIGVDLDGTLAHYDRWEGLDVVGEPIPPMVARVRRWIAEGREVRIFTARADTEEAYLPIAIRTIEDWCERHIGQRLPVTCKKDLAMIELWDDRAIGVLKNEGEPVSGSVSAIGTI